MSDRKDRAPWLLLPAILLTLGGMSVLGPGQRAQAAPPLPSKAAPPALGDDGDGDELLEHWGDPKYAQEERLQLAGIAGGFFLLGAFAYRKRRHTQTHVITSGRENASEWRKAA